MWLAGTVFVNLPFIHATALIRGYYLGVDSYAIFAATSIVSDWEILEVGFH